MWTPAGGERRGATLVLVVVIGGLLATLAIGTALQADRVAEVESAERGSAALTYRAESAAQALRLEVVRHYEESSFSSAEWLERLRDDLDGIDGWEPDPPPPGSRLAGRQAYDLLPGVEAWIDRAPEDVSWIEVVAASTAAGEVAADRRAPVSVRMRVNVAENEIFDLVMLTERTNCMFCHLQVNGDVGSIGFFRPGWGAEDSRGHGSGSGSRIDGDVYVGAKPGPAGHTGVSDDGDPSGRRDDGVLDDPTSANGAELAGDLTTDYNGPKLPEDTIGDDGLPDFPSFDPAEVAKRARAEGGTIWAGDPGNAAGDGSGTWVVPHGADWGSGKVTPDRSDFDSGAYQSVIDGNLVVVGTRDNPIELDGNVFVTGDVVIKGFVEGQGAVYAGRNVYVPGDIRYEDAPSSGFPLRNDDEGRAAIVEGASELRLAARSNVVIGDWTYTEGGDVKPVRKRQGQDFMSAQFGLEQDRHFKAGDPGSGEVSVEVSESGGTYYDDLGNEVPPSEVVHVDDASEAGEHHDLKPARYDAVMAPGNVVDDGPGDASFQPWISPDAFRRDVQGTEKYDVVQWRMRKLPGGIGSDNAHVRRELGDAWVDRPGLDDRDYAHTLRDNPTLGGKSGMFVRDRWGTWKGAETNVEWPTQVQHIDAFLFANKRIGGKVDTGKLTINGGVAAREIGVLAVGLRDTIGFDPDGDSPDSVPASVRDAFENDTNAYGERSDQMRLHYDYRLRNGGFGFDYFAGTGDLVYVRRSGAAEPPY